MTATKAVILILASALMVWMHSNDARVAAEKASRCAANPGLEFYCAEIFNEANKEEKGHDNY